MRDFGVGTGIDKARKAVWLSKSQGAAGADPQLPMLQLHAAYWIAVLCVEHEMDEFCGKGSRMMRRVALILLLCRGSVGHGKREDPRFARFFGSPWSRDNEPRKRQAFKGPTPVTAATEPRGQRGCGISILYMRREDRCRNAYNCRWRPDDRRHLADVAWWAS
jgi:hypothetical protein